MDDIKYKREILFRKAKGKQLEESYKKKITSLFSLDIDMLDFLTLKESDDILKKVSILKKNISKTFEVSELSSIFIEIKKNDSAYIFIDHDWEYCGAFYLSHISTKIKGNFKFGNYIKDSIIIINEDLSKKTYIDYYEENNNFLIDYDVYK